MILATGQPRDKQRWRCAFTLIELILVMALLVVAVSMIAPKMSGFMRGRSLDSEARQLFALIHLGQSRAVSEGMPMVLWIDAKNNTYGLEEETPGKNGDPKAESLTMSENLRIAVKNNSSSGMTTFHNLPAIRFLPDGTIDENSPQVLQLTDGTSVLWLIESRNHMDYEIRNTNK